MRINCSRAEGEKDLTSGNVIGSKKLNSLKVEKLSASVPLKKTTTSANRFSAGVCETQSLCPVTLAKCFGCSVCSEKVQNHSVASGLLKSLNFWAF